MIKLVLDDEMGECNIRIPTNFKELDRLSQLDYLGDAVDELSNLYKFLFTSPEEFTSDKSRAEFWKNYRRVIKR